MSAPTLSKYQTRYDPTRIQDHPDFRVLGDSETPSKEANISCAYNQHQQIHLIQKPMPEPEPGELLLHVRATGICG